MTEPREIPPTQQDAASHGEPRHSETAYQHDESAQHYPPPPNQPPNEPPNQPPSAGRRARARGTVGLVAAVALVAALVGGGAGAYVGQNWSEGAGSPSASSPADASPASTGGTVSSVAKAVTPSAVEIRAGQSTGSGVVITEDGEILTNNHVVSGASQIQVRLGDGETKAADVVGTDPELDMALIKVRDASGLTPAKLGDSNKVEVGDQVVAIGSPSGLTGSVTSGIVSALDRDVTVRKDDQRERQRDLDGWPFEFGGGEYNGEVGDQTTTYKAIQTDASINPGNSGGALANMKGEIVGINSAMHSNSASASEAGSVGLGFAIPVNDVKKVLDELRSGA